MGHGGADAEGLESSRDELGLTPAQRSWLTHIEQCEAEGLTYKAYCQREGLNVGGLYSARKKLRSAAESETVPAPSPPRVAAVRVAHVVAGHGAEVLLPNGVQIRVTLPDVDGLVEFVRGLAKSST